MRARFSVVAAVAVGLVMSIAGVASASASEFEASGAPTKLLAKNVGRTGQVFTTNKGELQTRCTKLSITEGEAKESKQATQEVTIKYESCTVAGTDPVEISPVKYLFNANGTVTLVNSVKILTEEATKGNVCTINVPGGQTFNGGVEYKNVEEEGHAGIDVTAINVNTVESEGVDKSGTLAQCAYSEIGAGNGKGTYSGTAFVWAESGSLAWKL